MAKFEYKLPDELTDKMMSLGKDFDRVSKKMLEAGGKVVLEATRAELSSVIGKNTKYPSRSTGELERSLGLTPAKLNRDGNFDVKVGFAGKRSDGTSNAMIAGIIENGKHNQPAKPFLKPARKKSQAACIAAMEKAFNEEVEKLQ